MNLRGKLSIGINKIILVKIQSTYNKVESNMDNRFTKFLNIKERTKLSEKQQMWELMWEIRVSIFQNQTFLF